MTKLNAARPATSGVDSNSATCERSENRWPQQKSSVKESDRLQIADSISDEKALSRRNEWNSHLNMQQIERNYRREAPMRAWSRMQKHDTLNSNFSRKLHRSM